MTLSRGEEKDSEPGKERDRERIAGLDWGALMREYDDLTFQHCRGINLTETVGNRYAVRDEIAERLRRAEAGPLSLQGPVKPEAVTKLLASITAEIVGPAGILHPVEMTAACSESCSCAEYGEFPATCYRFTPAFEASITNPPEVSSSLVVEASTTEGEPSGNPDGYATLRDSVRAFVREAAAPSPRLSAPTPEALRDLAEWFDNPNTTWGFSIGLMSERYTPGYLLRTIADEWDKLAAGSHQTPSDAAVQRAFQRLKGMETACSTLQDVAKIVQAAYNEDFGEEK